MTSNSDNPLNMFTDPFAGNKFVLPPTQCSEQRKSFFMRFNEIIGFLYISSDALTKYEINYEVNIIPNLPTKSDNPMKFSLNSGECIITTPKRIIEITKNGVNILTRQLFVMCYGSFETYLYQLFERSFQIIGIKDEEEIFNRSRDILMLKKWDGKFCSINEVFAIGYKAGELNKYFSNFNMHFEAKKYNNPLNFLDELAQVRHRIVHASSILEKDKMIFIDMKMFNGLLGFFFRLTDYVDSLFAKKFGYTQQKIDPAKA
jgi:hypothetical protein